MPWRVCASLRRSAKSGPTPGARAPSLLGFASPVLPLESFILDRTPRDVVDALEAGGGKGQPDVGGLALVQDCLDSRHGAARHKRKHRQHDARVTKAWGCLRPNGVGGH